jgi:hypothetical protein
MRIKSTDRKDPAEVRLTFKLNVVAHTPVEEIDVSPQAHGEKASEPVPRGNKLARHSARIQSYLRIDWLTLKC